MNQFFCWLLLAICAAMCIDASPVTTVGSSCSTWVTTAVATIPREIVTVLISVEPSVPLTTRTLPGVTTTFTWTEPVIQNATTITRLGSTSIMVAEYQVDTVIECAGNYTSLAAGSTSYSTLTSTSTQSSSYTTDVPVTSLSSDSTSSSTPSASVSTLLWTSTMSTLVSSGSSSVTSTYILTGASLSTLSSSIETSSVGYSASSSSGDWAVAFPSTMSSTPNFPSDAPMDPTSTQISSTETTMSSSPTSTPTANSTAPVVVPLYHAKMDNVTYFVPLCSDPTQTLWRPDGTNFTLSCSNITLSGGQVIPIIDNPPFGQCQPSDVNGDVCFTQRWNMTATEGGSITCQADSDSRLFSRDIPGDIKGNLSAIADALSEVKDVAGQVTNAAEQGLSAVGCAAQVAFEQVAAYYFNMVQQELSVVTEAWIVIGDFFKMVLGLMTAVTTPVGFWIDDTDQQFQTLACYVSDGDSAIWRTISKHTALHQGLNTLSSLSNVITFSGLIEEIMSVIFGSLFAEYDQFITASGAITQGWTQAMRVCTTKWDIDSLQDPDKQDPEEDDEDDWLPRYQIFTTPDASMAQLKALEHALGGDGWEISSSNATDWIKGYVVDLNIMQALLPQTMPFISQTQRFVWDGSESTSIIKDEPAGSTKRSTEAKSSLSNNTAKAHNHQARAFDPNAWSVPTGDQRLSLDNGHYLKTISQQKGQDLDSFTDYTYADPQGEGSWIIVIDSGFDLNHEKLQSTNYRKVVQYVVPNEFSLPKLQQHDVEAGWVAANAVIDDNMPLDEAYGHGTGVACVAAGLGTGVASRANLLLVKLENYFVNTITGEKRQPGLTVSALQDAFSSIRDQASAQRMPYGKRVINLSMVLGADSNAGSFLEFFFQRQVLEGTTIVMAAGNSGYDYSTDTVPLYQAEQSPQKYATDDNSYIVVGGTYHDGSIWEWTTVPGGRPGSGSSDATTSVWAQADDVYTCDANGASNAMRLRDGTSFSAPQVAGLVAYMESYPWPSDKENPFSFTGSGGSVASRIKAMICNTYAYQRLPASEIVNKALDMLQKFPVPRKFPWAIPDKVDVIYNMAFGPQKCKDVEGFPNVKRDGLSCPLPLGGSSPSSASYVTDTPTYLASTWSGFSSATGSESTPDGVFITASFTMTETTVLPTTTVPSTTEWDTTWVTASTTVGGTTTTYTVPSSSPTTTSSPTSSPSSTSDSGITIYTTTVGSSCCPYPDDACGVESMSLSAPIYCSAITARGFEYLNDIATTTSHSGPRSTADSC
ncbi:hypothetical protein N0V82_003405 [Gnomoniopsis sp. IMI 355080]|nr:hypothetical protein N0V82_003405 [Gnomoniopsis sp. IMI 355080]